MSHSLIVWSLLLLIRWRPSPFGSRNAIPSTWPGNWKSTNVTYSRPVKNQTCDKCETLADIIYMLRKMNVDYYSIEHVKCHIPTCQDSNRLWVIFPQSPPVPHLRYHRLKNQIVQFIEFQEVMQLKNLAQAVISTTGHCESCVVQEADLQISNYISRKSYFTCSQKQEEGFL